MCIVWLSFYRQHFEEMYENGEQNFEEMVGNVEEDIILGNVEPEKSTLQVVSTVSANGENFCGYCLEMQVRLLF